jgi:hypothetical protein
MATPALITCFWCNAPKGGIAVLKDILDAPEVPKVCTDTTPCDDCREKMGQGITLMEVVPHNPTRNLPELIPGVAVTGRWRVVTAEDLKEQGLTDVMIGMIVQQKRGFLQGEIFERFLPEDQQAEKIDGSSDNSP